jgi:hypothetical protein
MMATIASAFGTVERQLAGHGAKAMAGLQCIKWTHSIKRSHRTYVLPSSGAGMDD